MPPAASGNPWSRPGGLVPRSLTLLKRFGITGARWSPDGAEVILKLRFFVVKGDIDYYMTYYKQRYRAEHHLARYDEDTIDRLNLAA